MKTVKFGTPVKESFSHLALAIAEEKGIWKQNNVQVEWVPFNGLGPMNQAMVAGDIKIGIYNGASFSQVVEKGLKGKIIAEVLGPPINFVVIVPGDSPIRSFKDLKDKRLSITSFGSGTDIFAQLIAKSNGWDPKDGIKRIPLGGLDAQAAALQTGQTDAMLWTLEGAYALQEKAGMRILGSVDQAVPKFEMEVIVATQDLLADEELIRNVLRGWFQAMDYMRKNRSETVTIGSKTFNMPQDVLEKVYDQQMPAISTNGAVSPDGLKATLDSLILIGALEKAPAPEDVYLPKFVPIKP